MDGAIESRMAERNLGDRGDLWPPPLNKICAALVSACRRHSLLWPAVAARGVESFGGLGFFAAGCVPDGAPVQHQTASRAGCRLAPLLELVDLLAAGGRLQ
jgi:hypothetical protein